MYSIHWSDFVTNDEIHSRTEQPDLPDTIRSRRLSFFGHLSRAAPYSRVISGRSRLAFGALLESGDGGLAGPDNPG